MKRELLGIANAALRPLGVQIYKQGMDMESILKRTAPKAACFRICLDLFQRSGER